MALATAKQHTNTGQTAGADVAVPEYDGIIGTGTPVYADDSGNIVVSVESIPDGTSAMVEDLSANDTNYGQLTYDFKFTAAPSVAAQCSEIRNSTVKVANHLISFIGSNPTFRVRGGADAALTGWETSTTLALNTWYRVETALQVGAGTTDGKTKARLTRLSDSVVLASGESTNLDSGTTNIHHHQTGKNGTSGTVGLLIDNLAFWDSAYEYVPAAYEVVDAGADQTVEPWATVTLTSSIAGTWVQNSGTAVTLSGSGVSSTFSAPVLMDGDTLVFTVTATDNGHESTDSVSVLVSTCNEWYKHTDGTLHPLQITN